MFFVLLAGFSLEAQTVNFTFRQTRATVPVGFTGSLLVSNNVPYTTNGLVADGGGYFVIRPISLAISGLPTGVTYSLTNLGNTTPTLFTATALRTNANNTLRLGINFNFDGSTPEGTYPVRFNATGGATNSYVFFLDVAHIWNGSFDVPTSGAGNWSSPGNWLGGGVPNSENSVVVFIDQGAQTNSVVVTSTTTNMLINSIVDGDITVGSLRFAQWTNFNLTGWHNLQIASGKTLTITGSGGLNQLRDYMDETAGITEKQGVTISGAGKLVVSNQSANVTTLIDNPTASNGSHGSFLDLSQLDRFDADINVLGLGDPWAYPGGFFNLLTNGYNGAPRKFTSDVYFARTNVIKAAFVDAYNYTNATDREYAISIVSTLTGNSSQSVVPIINLGISNVFYADSFLVSGAAQRPQVQFNPIFGSSNCFALFRNVDGVSRMTTFAEADAAGPGTIRGNIKAVVDFSRGTIDLLADQFYVGRDRPEIEYNQNPNYQGTFTMANGIIDANIMVLGYRQFPGTTNTWATYSGYCEGRLIVISNGVVRVNQLLTLGSTAEGDSDGLGSAGNTEWGKVELFNGATLMANQINVGGPVYGASANNYIIVSNNATLNVSNTIAGPQQSLDSITFQNAHFILTLNATNTVAAVYATNFNTVGSSSLTIAGIKNSESLTDGLKIPLFKWLRGGAPNFTTVQNLSGINGQIVDDGTIANQKDFQVILSAPKNLKWQGYSGAEWDTSTFNWLDLDTGLHTNFSAGDNVRFDDSTAVNTINVSAAVIPGSITVSNLVNDYIFSDTGGSISGGATMTKTGAARVRVDCPAGAVGVQLVGGVLAGSGSIGSANVAAGAVLDFNGGISGGVTCAGLAIFESGVDMIGSLSISPGGVSTNHGIIRGSFTVGQGSVLVNELNGEFASFSSGTVSSNAFLRNRGYLGKLETGGNITINSGGTFEDTGEGWIYLSGTLTVAAGATFIPGGDGIGTTYVYKNGTGLPGRILLSQGSTNVFKVNNDNGTFTQLGSGYQDFGGSSSVRTFNGCIIKIINMGSTPFSAGDAYQFFFNSDDNGPIALTGSATNTYPVIIPTAPADGLVWAISNITVSGEVKVSGVSTTPFDVLYVPTVTTLITTNSTNNVIIGELSWPQDHMGWRLQTQTRTLDQGISMDSTNWVDVFGAAWSTDALFTNNINTNGSATFYRMVYP